MGTMVVAGEQNQHNSGNAEAEQYRPDAVGRTGNAGGRKTLYTKGSAIAKIASAKTAAAESAACLCFQSSPNTIPTKHATRTIM